jgi:hypothetical protein
VPPDTPSPRPHPPAPAGSSLARQLLTSDWEALALDRLDALLSPDVFLFVLDSVSGLDVLDPGPTPAVSRGLPGLREFARHAVIFPDARTTSATSIAALASTFTGLYPWVHGLHSRGLDRLPDRHATVASVLGRDGYGTFSLSGSSVVCDAFGLTRGFKHAAWGGRPTPTPSDSSASGPSSGSTSSLPPLSRSGGYRLPNDPFSPRIPSWVSAGARAVGEVASRAPAEPRLSSAWIEPTFEKVLARIPEDIPLFGFVNLADTPPALPGEGDGTSIGGHRRRLLHEAALSASDLRLERLLSAVHRHGRWANSLVIVTSDRGSTIPRDPAAAPAGELDDQASRVPLLVKFPTALHGGAVARGAASLVDILPTVLDSVGLARPPSLPGVPLQSLVSRKRAGRLLAMIEGSASSTLPPHTDGPTHAHHGPGVVSFTREAGVRSFQPLGPSLIPH